MFDLCVCLLYSCQMHIVCIKKDLNTTQAVMDPEGLAVLAFFIEVRLNRLYGSSKQTTLKS